MRKPTASEQAEMDAIFDKIEAEDAAEHAAEPMPTDEATKKEAAFLLDWSKGKPITKYASAGTFYSCGKWMTKLTPKEVAGLLESGLAVGTAQRFTMVKGGK